jgi:hypothetical protein
VPIGGTVGRWIGCTEGGTTPQAIGAQTGGTSMLRWQIGCAVPLTHAQRHAAQLGPAHALRKISSIAAVLAIAASPNGDNLP